MPRRLVIHVGPHKSGSTSIQMQLAQHAEQLAAAGVAYEVPGSVAWFAHHELAYGIRDGDPERLAAFGAASELPVRCVSSEEFSRLRADDWTRALTAVDDSYDSVEFVVYVRNRADSVYSWWQELVRHGSIESLTSSVLQRLLEPPLVPMIQPLTLLDALPADPRVHLRIVSFDRLVDQGGDVVEVFLTSVLGLGDMSGIATGERAYAGMGPREVELIRLMSLALSERGGRPSYDFHSQVVQTVQQDPRAAAAARELVEVIEPCLTEIDLNPLHEVFVRSDEHLEATYGRFVVNPPEPGHPAITAWRTARLRRYLDDRQLRSVDLQRAMHRLAILVGATG